MKNLIRHKKLIPIVIFVVCFASCDLFTTRDPENPVQSRTSWVPATTSDILISNLKSALLEKSTENYLKCFVDSAISGKSFVFVPSIESFSIYQNIFLNWSLRNEKNYFDNIKSKLLDNAGITLSFFNEVKGTIISDSMSFSADYILIANHNVDGFPKEFHGIAQFTLYRNLRGEWSILSWKDAKKNEHLTWSDLKGRFAY